MNNEDKILAILEQMQGDISDLKQGQVATNARFDGIDKRFDGIDKRLDGIDKRFDGIDKRLDGMQSDIDQIREDTAITREVTNELGEWAEVVADVLKVRYPVEK